MIVVESNLTLEGDTFLSFNKEASIISHIVFAIIISAFSYCLV